MKKSACLVEKEFFPPPLGVKTAKSGEGAAAADVAQRCSQKISFPRFVSRRRPWVFISVSCVFAPAPGSAFRRRIVYFRFASPAPKPGGFGLRLRAKRKTEDSQW
jgi:hypothetical protein